MIARRAPQWGCFKLLTLGVLAGMLITGITTLRATPRASPPGTPAAVTAEPAQLIAYAATPEIAATAAVEAPAAPDIPPGTFLLVPGAEVYAPVVRAYRAGATWEVGQLGLSVGHLQGTTAPGEPGNVVLAGHVELADGRAGPFARLKDSAIGDVLYLMQDGHTTRYTIIAVTYTAATDLTPLYATGDNRVTLITCDTYNFVTDTYQQRLVVIAQQA